MHPALPQVGDGDCGSTVAGAARALLKDLGAGAIALHYPPQAALQVGGAVYSTGKLAAGGWGERARRVHRSTFGATRELLGGLICDSERGVRNSIAVTVLPTIRTLRRTHGPFPLPAPLRPLCSPACQVARCVRSAVGGSSGALYDILITAAGRRLKVRHAARAGGHVGCGMSHTAGIHRGAATTNCCLCASSHRILASLNESRAVVERNLVLPEVLTCPPWTPATGQAELVRLRPGTHLKSSHLAESHS